MYLSILLLCSTLSTTIIITIHITVALDTFPPYTTFPTPTPFSVSPPPIYYSSLTNTFAPTESTQEVFDEGGIPFPFGLFPNFSVPNYTISDSVSNLLIVSRWRSSNAVEFTFDYVLDLATLLFIFMGWFVVFAIILMFGGFTVCCKKLSTQNIPIFSMLWWRFQVNHIAHNSIVCWHSSWRTGCLRSRSRIMLWCKNTQKLLHFPLTTNNQQQPSFPAATMEHFPEPVIALEDNKFFQTFPKMRIIYVICMFLAWVNFLTAFSRSFHMFGIESDVQFTVANLNDVFTRVDNASSQLHRDLSQLSELLETSSLRCYLNTNSNNITQIGWQQYQTSANSSLEYLSRSIAFLTQMLDKGPAQIAPSMLQTIESVDVISRNVMKIRAAASGALLLFMTIIIPVLLLVTVPMSCFHLSFVKKMCPTKVCTVWYTRVAHSTRLTMFMALMVVFLFTLMVSFLFAFLFLLGDMCQSNPIILMGRVGGLLENIPQIYAAPRVSSVTLHKWCADVLSNLADPLNFGQISDYNNTNSPTTNTLKSAPISTEMLCYYGTCDNYYHHNDGEMLNIFVSKLWIPMLNSARVLDSIEPNATCTLFVKELMTLTKSIVIASTQLILSISCPVINPILVELLYEQMCNSYV
jgi:hypothetical protein